jgi:hypothetical protein
VSKNFPGGPAFPVGFSDDDARMSGASRGMTLRDYFAAAAMQGYIAARIPSDSTYDDLAEKAFKAADSMLDERKR